MIKNSNISGLHIMGVINITPDSFFEGSRVHHLNAMLVRIDEMAKNGANIIDIGAISTRPGADIISQEEEYSRLKEIIPVVKKEFPQLFFSIDTVYGKTAKACLEAGWDMINDVSAGSIDKSLIDVARIYQCDYILMHAKGLPRNMQENPEYQSVIIEIMEFFAAQIKKLNESGVSKIIVDPGFGFGKTIDHNYEILQKLGTFRIFDKRILVGMSRKSMITKYLEISADEALPASTALHMVALQNGANILRVHDPKEAKQTIQLYEKLQNNFR